jgi:hypothetical protein
MEEKGHLCSILAGNLREMHVYLGRYLLTGENDVRMDVKVVGWDEVD